MTVFEVAIHAAHEVARKADVIELVLPIERVDAGFAADHLSNDFAVIVEDAPRDLLKKAN
jgi:hypothetical protein